MTGIAAAVRWERLREMITALPISAQRQFVLVVLSLDELARGARVH